MPANPFEVLRLDPASPEEEVVRQAGRLRQRAPDEAALNAVRQAVQALTARPEDRALYALLTHPQPRYAWPALDRFASAFRRAPATAREAIPCPEMDLAEFTELLQRAAAEELQLPPLPFELPTTAEEPEEVRRQTAEVLWQSLVFDPRA